MCLWCLHYTLSSAIFLLVLRFHWKFITVVNGQIKRLQDDDIQSNVLELVGSNVQSTYITCPADPTATLGIKLPFLVMIVKNMKKYFTFEIHVLDDKNVRRRFRASNFQVCKFSHKSIFYPKYFYIYMLFVIVIKIDKPLPNVTPQTSPIVEYKLVLN